MNLLMAIHIAGGMLALPAGTLAVVARKGGRLHARAGTLFFGAMLVLGVTAASSSRSVARSGSPIADHGLLFRGNLWSRAPAEARRQFEIAACGAALSWPRSWPGGFAGDDAGRLRAVFVLGGICLLAGLLDLNAILRRN